MHNLLTARGARLLRPIMVFGVMGLAIFVGICRYMMHKNHWQDVLVGYLLGLSLAVYLVRSVDFNGKASKSRKVVWHGSPHIFPDDKINFLETFKRMGEDDFEKPWQGSRDEFSDENEHRANTQMLSANWTSDDESVSKKMTLFVTRCVMLRHCTALRFLSPKW